MSDTTLPNGEKRAGSPAFDDHGDPDYRPRGPSNESLSKPEESRLENGEGPLPVGEVDAATERRIIRKIDTRIVPMVMWVYLMNMMDRVNIGNARLFGLEEDLGMDPEGPQFQIAVSVLFITYCLFETPSNMIIKRLQPGRYLAGLTFCWGLVATFSAFVQSFGALVACRLLLGLFEAGFFPGVILYLSMWYGKKNLALRVAFFFSTAAISGFAGGLVSYGISELDGSRGWRAWRWIILINGAPTILTGMVMPFVLPNSPEKAKFLTDDDRANLERIQVAQMGRAHNLRNLVKSDAVDALKDWTTWAYCFALFPTLTMLYSFVVFLPTIIDGMGQWNEAEVQAMTAPVYAVGTIVYMICARVSDKTQRRGYFVMGSICSAILGYAMLIADAGNEVSYAGCFFVSIGIFVSSGISFAWVPSNNPRYGKRAVSTGLHLTIGNASGVASPFLFSSSQAPTYRPGYGASIGMLFLSLCLNILLHLHFKRQNKQRDQGRHDHLLDGKTDLEVEAMGERSPKFRFSI